jgi:hypothetical protein
MMPIKRAIKAAFNHYGLEITRCQRDTTRRQPLPFDYEPHIAPRWGYGTAPHMRIGRAISANHERYAQTLDRFLQYRDALSAIPRDRREDDPTSPHWNNLFLSGLDAASLVCFVLETRPRVYLEIGSGNSTKFARHAIKLGGLTSSVISVDPHPRAEIDGLCDKIFRLPLEEANHQTFSILQAGDILFFDGSHRIFTNSDVVVFFLELLPSLPPGVLVHIHDVFLPLDYPPEWNDRLYSEQYMLAAMLLCRERPFDVVLPNSYVMLDTGFAKTASELMRGTGVAPAPAVSFWIRTREQGDR